MSGFGTSRSGGGHRTPQDIHRARLMDPTRLVPSGRQGDERMLVEAQINFQNALWMALLRPWPKPEFWAQFWRMLYPHWPSDKTWPAPQFEFFTFGIRFTPDIAMMAVRDLRGSVSPHPTAVRLYTPEDRWDALSTQSPRLYTRLSDYGTVWSWRTAHDPFPAQLEPDEIFAPTQPNPMLTPVAHALALLQPSEQELQAQQHHWATVLRGRDSHASSSSSSPSSSERTLATPLLSPVQASQRDEWDAGDEDDDGDDGDALPAIRPRQRITPSVSIRLLSEQRIAETDGIADALVNGIGDPAALDRLWNELRSAFETTFRRDQEQVNAVADQLVGLRRQVDVHFDVQCAVPSAAVIWKRDEATRWARQLAKRHDDHESILPLLRLAQQQAPGNLSIDERIAVETVIKKVHALATRALPECEAWLTGRLEMLQILCAALNSGDHPWLPSIAGRRRCPRCGKEEAVADDTTDASTLGTSTGHTDEATGDRAADPEDWLR